MILRLPADSLLTSVLERFALRVCESNVHWALQLIWIVYGALEENRPEVVSGDAEMHLRAARLLQLVEQAVVYGAKLVNRDSLRTAALSHNINLWLRSMARDVQRRVGGHAREESLSSPNQHRSRLPYHDQKQQAHSATLSLDSAALAELGGLTAAAETAALSGADVALEGYLLKRKARDSWGVWRCCGEAWTRRWFSLRGSVLFYSRRPNDSRARGSMPMGQCRLELRSTPHSGEYIKLSARFSRRVLRVRGASPEETQRWFRVLRASAGLPPLPLAPLALAHTRNSAAQRPRLASDGTHAAHAGAAHQSPSLPPIEILEGAHWMQLSTSQRCSWLYITAQRDFVRSLAALSEELYAPDVPSMSRRPEASAAKSRLRQLLSELRIPPLAYVPLTRSSHLFRHVVRISPDEVGVFVTRERASALLCIEVVADERRRKLSELFQAVRDDGDGKLFEDLSADHGPTVLDVLAARDGEDDDEHAHAHAQARAHAQGASTAAHENDVAEDELNARRICAESLDALYGEPWVDQSRRVRRHSAFGKRPGWQLEPIISKTNDDVRQEVFVMQLISLFAEVFPEPLRLCPYRILSTGQRSGLIQVLTDTQSFHALKGKASFTTLRDHFERHYGGPGSEAFQTAQNRFLSSLAAYSVVSFVLGIKDRHNGNILLHRKGHLIHIDFGFVFGKAPGGACSLEGSVPFKLTREMVDVLGGPSSPLYLETFTDLCVTAFRAARSQADTLLALIEITAFRSSMPCFQGITQEALLQQVRDRLLLDVPDDQLRGRVQQLIGVSYNSVLTRAYDDFQLWSNGIRR